jgi:hypothetical protein
MPVLQIIKNITFAPQIEDHACDGYKPENQMCVQVGCGL